MQDLGAEREVRKAIYDAFEATVVGKLSHLIAQLDELLTDTDLDALVDAPLGPADTASASALDAPLRIDEWSLSSNVDTAEPSRLLGVLAGVQRSSGDDAVDEETVDAGDFASRLAQAVTPRGVTLQADEQHTVTVVAELVQRVVEQPNIDVAVKRRLWRLLPPFLMLALQDDGYLESELEAARHDPLTGLLDRAALRARLESALRQRARGAVGPALCLVDVDGFSAISRRLGHQVGGRLLRSIADVLRKQVNNAAFAARIRGNEFAVLLPAAGSGAGCRFAERFSAHSPKHALCSTVRRYVPVPALASSKPTRIWLPRRR
jgi:diguanylate cyclase (GGDEF)-like protein